MAIAATLHTLAAAVLMGGLAFLYFVMRPAAGSVDPGVRLPLWRRTFQYFLPWLIAAALLLPATGYYMIAADTDPPNGKIHLKHLASWLANALLIYVYLVPYRRMENAMGQGERPRAARHLVQIHRIMLCALIALVIASILGTQGRLIS